MWGSPSYWWLLWAVEVEKHGSRRRHWQTSGQNKVGSADMWIQKDVLGPRVGPLSPPGDRQWLALGKSWAAVQRWLRMPCTGTAQPRQRHQAQSVWTPVFSLGKVTHSTCRGLCKAARPVRHPETLQHLSALSVSCWLCFHFSALSTWWNLESQLLWEPESYSCEPLGSPGQHPCMGSLSTSLPGQLCPLPGTDAFTLSILLVQPVTSSWLIMRDHDLLFNVSNFNIA